MTDKFKGWYPDYIENEKEREPILKLAKMMTGRAKKKLGLGKMTKYASQVRNWAKRSQTVFRRSWVLKRSPEMIRSIGDWHFCVRTSRLRSH